MATATPTLSPAHLLTTITNIHWHWTKFRVENFPLIFLSHRVRWYHIRGVYPVNRCTRVDGEIQPPSLYGRANQAHVPTNQQDDPLGPLRNKVDSPPLPFCRDSSWLGVVLVSDRFHQVCEGPAGVKRADCAPRHPRLYNNITAVSHISSVCPRKVSHSGTLQDPPLVLSPTAR